MIVEVVGLVPDLRGDTIYLNVVVQPREYSDYNDYLE